MPVKRQMDKDVIHTHTHVRTRARARTVEYYSAIEKNEIMSFAATWMNLETLREVSQTKANK